MSLLSTTVMDRLAVSQSSMLCIQALIEYTENLKSKIATFVTNSTVSYLSVILPDSQGRNIVACISSEDYNNALDDEEGVSSLKVSDDGVYMDFNNSDIIQAIEDTTQENVIQNEFLKYCIDGVQNTAEGFLSILSAKYHNFSGIIMDKYSQLISTDTIHSLSNFLNLFSSAQLNQDAQQNYLELVSTIPYSDCPNVWLTAIVNITGEILSFFKGVFDNFLNIGETLQKLGNSIVNLMTWLVSKVSANLLTVYEKGDKKFGVMDFPLLQVPLCTYDLSRTNGPKANFDSSLIDNALTSIFDNIHASNYLSGGFSFWRGAADGARVINLDDRSGVSHQWRAFNMSTIKMRFKACIECLLNLMDNTDTDGHILMPIDVVIPTSQLYGSGYEPFGAPDFIIRIGPAKIDNADMICLQLFAADSFDVWNSFTDAQNYERLWDGIDRVQYNIKDVIPLQWRHLVNESLVSDAENWSKVDGSESWCNMLLDTQQASWGDNNISPGSHAKMIFNKGADLNTYISNLVANTPNPLTWAGVNTNLGFIQLILGLLSYACVNANLNYDQYVYLPLGSTNYQIKIRDVVDRAIVSYVDYNIRDNFDAYTWYGSIFYEYDGMADGYWLFFKPYSKYSLTATAIHLQDNTERIKEAQSLIFKVLIAIAAAVITYKVMKWRKNRRINFELAQARADKLSWDLFDPNNTTTGFADWLKARNKVMHMQRVNAALGFLSPLSLIEHAGSLVGGAVGAVAGIAGQETNTPASDSKVNLNSVIKLIKG